MKYDLSTLNETVLLEKHGVNDSIYDDPEYKKSNGKFDWGKYAKHRANQIGGAAIGYGLHKVAGSPGGKAGAVLMTGVGAHKAASGYRDDLKREWKDTKEFVKAPVAHVKKNVKENIKFARDLFDIDDEQNKKDSKLKTAAKIGYKVATSPLTLASTAAHVVPGAVLGAGLGIKSGLEKGKEGYDKVSKMTGSKLAGLGAGALDGAIHTLARGSVGTLAGGVLGGYAGYKNAKHFLGKPIGEKHDDMLPKGLHINWESKPKKKKEEK